MYTSFDLTNNNENDFKTEVLEIININNSDKNNTIETSNTENNLNKLITLQLTIDNTNDKLKNNCNDINITDVQNLTKELEVNDNIILCNNSSTNQTKTSSNFDENVNLETKKYSQMYGNLGLDSDDETENEEYQQCKSNLIIEKNINEKNLINDSDFNNKTTHKLPILQKIETIIDSNNNNNDNTDSKNLQETTKIIETELNDLKKQQQFNYVLLENNSSEKLLK